MPHALFCFIYGPTGAFEPMQETQELTVALGVLSTVFSTNRGESRPGPLCEYGRIEVNWKVILAPLVSQGSGSTAERRNQASSRRLSQ